MGLWNVTNLRSRGLIFCSLYFICTLTMYIWYSQELHLLQTLTLFLHVMILSAKWTLHIRCILHVFIISRQRENKSIDTKPINITGWKIGMNNLIFMIIVNSNYAKLILCRCIYIMIGYFLQRYQIRKSTIIINMIPLRYRLIFNPCSSKISLV